jgi:pyruvate/2-oxoglutarate/acetoin dehydrogenase E1 component
VSDRQDIISFGRAVNEAITLAMEQDPGVICYGLGTTDPKGIFGTTLGLRERFGDARVFDMPTSENAMTGVAVGAALAGLRPVMTHQRLDFFLLAMDQLVNSAAKWHYMFGGKQSVPITIRLIIGRGWGQGPTHSQNLQAWFAHIPGLKVVMPATADDAKGLLLESIFDPNPVVFIEHRWLHNSVAAVPSGDYRVPIGKARIVRPGTDLTIVSMSYMTVEAMHAAEFLARRFGISAEVLDLRTIRPLDWPGIFESVSRTGRLLALDSGFTTGSVAGEIVARVSMGMFGRLLASPRRLAMPDIPEPTSPALTRGFYVSAGQVVKSVLDMLDQPAIDIEVEIPESEPHDVPGSWFRGPF